MNAWIREPKGIAMTTIVLLIAASMTFGAARAKAVCCDRFLIDNLSTCEFWVCIDDGTAAGYCQQMGLGSNFIDPPGCWDEWRAFVYDVSGTRVYFPLAGSINVWVTTACCVKIEWKADCQWEITLGIC